MKSTLIVKLFTFLKAILSVSKGINGLGAVVGSKGQSEVDLNLRSDTGTECEFQPVGAPQTGSQLEAEA